MAEIFIKVRDLAFLGKFILESGCHLQNETFGIPFIHLVILFCSEHGYNTNERMASYLLSMEPWTAAKKNFKLAWRCHQFLSRFLAKGHLPPESHQSLLLANDKGDNEMIPGAAHRSPGINLTAEENPGKPQLGDHR